MKVKNTPSFRTSREVAPIRNPSEASALSDRFRLFASLRPE
jgi:hypothetical protein